MPGRMGKTECQSIENGGKTEVSNTCPARRRYEDIDLCYVVREVFELYQV